MADHPRQLLLRCPTFCIHAVVAGIRPTRVGLYAGLSTLSGAGWHLFFYCHKLERRQDTLIRHIDVLREAVRKTRQERPFHIDAWVVLPDHIHCVLTLPPGDDDFSNRWKSIKIRFVQAIPRTERRSSVRIAKGERGIYPRAQVATTFLGALYPRRRCTNII